MLSPTILAAQDNGGDTIVNFGWLTNNLTAALTLGVVLAAVVIVWGIKTQSMGRALGILAVVLLGLIVAGIAPNADAIGSRLAKSMFGGGA